MHHCLMKALSLRKKFLHLSTKNFGTKLATPVSGSLAIDGSAPNMANAPYEWASPIPKTLRASINSELRPLQFRTLSARSLSSTNGAEIKGDFVLAERKPGLDGNRRLPTRTGSRGWYFRCLVQVAERKQLLNSPDTLSHKTTRHVMGLKLWVIRRRAEPTKRF